MTNTIGALDITYVTDFRRSRSPLFESLRIPGAETLYTHNGAPSRVWDVKCTLTGASVWTDYAALENMEASAVPYYYNLYVAWAAKQFQGFGKIQSLKQDGVGPVDRIDVSFTLMEIPGWGRTYLNPYDAEVNLADVDFLGRSSDILSPSWANHNYSIDKLGKQFQLEYIVENQDEESGALAVTDDTQASFWSITHTGSGSYDLTVSNDTAKVVKGTDCLKGVVASGSYVTAGVYHTYGGNQDWSSYEFLGFWLYGCNTGLTVSIILNATDSSNYYSYNLTDNWVGWRRVVIPFGSFTITGSPAWTTILTIQILYMNINAFFIFYLDRVVIDVGKWAYLETQIPDYLATSSPYMRLLTWNGAAYSPFWDDSLAIHHPLNEGRGTTAYDRSGNNRDATLVGAVAWTTSGKYSRGLEFSGVVGEYCTIPSFYCNRITVSAWVKRNGSQVVNAVIVGKGRNTIPYYQWILGWGALTYENKIRWGVSTGGAVNLLISANVIPDATWTHLVGTYDGVYERLYINAVPETPIATAGNIDDYGRPILFGWYEYGAATTAYHYKGTLDEVRVYDRALTSQEVLDLYTQGRSAQFLDGTYLSEAYLSEEGVRVYQAGTIGAAKSGVNSFSGTMTYSQKFGCKNRLGLGFKMAPATFEQTDTYSSPSLTGNLAINKLKLKTEVWYDQDATTWSD